MESNKEARRILNRHHVDLSCCQFSCCGMDVMLGGRLCKHNGSDFNAPQIQALVFDFKRYLAGYTVIGDFENWNFNSERITFLGDKIIGHDEEESEAS